jgi:hypothetical protein
MPTPSSQTPGVHPARRQLDELDALLQQMLALPANRQSDADTTNPENRPISAPARDEERAFRGYQTPLGDQTATSATDTSSPVIEETTLPPETDVPQTHVQTRVEDLPREIYAFNAGEAPARLSLEPPPDFQPSSRPSQLVRRHNKQIPARWWPLLIVNAVFDLCTFPLGRAGRWLRSPAGRTFLGLSGLALLAAAAVCAALGWSGWSW